MCDDVLHSIFTRLPARTAVASMSLSRHHRRLIRSPEFRRLHCRLCPPLPRPHVAFVAPAKVRRSSDQDPATGFHGFHVAGAGCLRSSHAPMRALAGATYLSKKYVNTCDGVVLAYLSKKYVNTCDGVVLLAGEPRPAARHVRPLEPGGRRRGGGGGRPCLGEGRLRHTGAGLRPASKTYKLLLSRRRKREFTLDSRPAIDRYPTELLVCTLDGAGKQPQLRTVSPAGLDGEISGESLYIDGAIYLLHLGKSAVLAFDVDEEKATMISWPGEDNPGRHWHVTSKLMEMSGWPCLERHDWCRIAIWLLTVDRQWEQRCVIGGDDPICRPLRGDLDRFSVAGIWDCGGVLVLHLRRAATREDVFCLYHVATRTLSRADLPGDLTPAWSDHALCWGYKPTLVSPGSIADKLLRDESRRERMMWIMEALKPIHELDKRRGREATLGTVCFMEFLVGIMQELPRNLQDVIQTKLRNLDPSTLFNDVPSLYEDAIYH